MVEKKIGTAVYRRDLSPVLAIFRLVPEAGDSFPDYKAGQYIALRRENCRLTKKVTRLDGQIEFTPDLDENGMPRRGPVTHSYSISSAPYETREHGYLEFYVILQMYETGVPGRLTESLFQLDPLEDNAIVYYSRIAGEFTLEKRAAGFRNVVMIGTGTGLAPFASMIKQLHHEATSGKTDGVRYTLFTANRGIPELGYHNELLTVEREQRIDFVYVPSISRPIAHESLQGHVGCGRANNMLRSVLDLPLKEEEDVQAAYGTAELLESVVQPTLPTHVTKRQLRDRMNPAETVILNCGNPDLMNDIKHVASMVGIRCEQEEW